MNPVPFSLLHSPDILVVSPCHAAPVTPWTIQVQSVDLNWRHEKCARFALVADMAHLFPDEPVFSMLQTQPPYKTLPVAGDGDCLFR